MPTISKSTLDYLNQVVNPIDVEKPAQVPDLSQLNSICAKAQTDITLVNTLATPLTGILLFLRHGYSDLWFNHIDLATANSDAIGYFYVNGGVLQDTGTPFKFSEIDFDNTLTILSLAAGYRTTACGMRVLPTVETVTDTSLPYISYVIGGQLTPYELESAFNTGAQIEPIIRQSPCSKTYGNNSGMCARYDPFQTDKQLFLLPTDFGLDPTYRTDAVRVPCIYMKFSQQIAAAAEFPFIFHSTIWSEITLKLPTPLYSHPSPIDYNWEQIRAIMSTCSEEYPMVVQGHSFSALLAGAPAFISLIKNAISAGSNLFQTVRSIRNGNRASNRMVRPRKPISRKPPQKKRQPRNNMPGRGQRVKRVKRNIRNV
jgi:hypothetical protein